MNIPASRQSRILKKLTSLPAAERAAVPSIFPASPASSPSGFAVDAAAAQRSESRAASDLEREEIVQREGEFVKAMSPVRNTSQDLSSLLDANRSVGDWEGAMEAFSSALASPDFSPTSEQIRLLVLTAAEEGVVERTEDLPKALTNRGTGSITAAQQAAADLIAALADVDASENACRVLEWARHNNSTPGEAEGHVYTAAIQACEAGQRWEEAIAIHNEMKRSRHAQPDTASYACVMSVLEACKRTAETEAITREMPSREADEMLASYSALVHTWSARHGRRAMRRF